MGFVEGNETVALINAHAATLFDGKLFLSSCISECTSDADSFPKSLQRKSRTLKTFLVGISVCGQGGEGEVVSSTGPRKKPVIAKPNSRRLPHFWHNFRNSEAFHIPEFSA